MKKFSLKPKKGDLAAVFFVFICVAAFFIPRLFVKSESAVAVVYVNGREVQRLDLKKDTVVTVTETYTAEICVEGGQVYVKESDCPNGDCVRTGKISKKGQSIVCLPNKLAVRIEGGELDAVIG